jgi:predicted ester cyclase
MGEDANIELARRLLSAFETGDDSAVDELVHPAHRDHASTGAPSGPEGVREAIRRADAAFADRRIVPQDIIASGDRVVARIRFSATRTSDLCAGVRRVEVEHIHIWRVAEGRLAEHWMVADDPAAIRLQLTAR